MCSINKSSLPISREYLFFLYSKSFHNKIINLWLSKVELSLYELRFVCPICFKSFKTRQTRKIHMYIHSTIKYFVCKFCQRRFSTSSNLNRHVKNIHNSMCLFCLLFAQNLTKDWRIFWGRTEARRRLSGEWRLGCALIKMCNLSYVKSLPLIWARLSLGQQEPQCFPWCLPQGRHWVSSCTRHTTDTMSIIPDMSWPDFSLRLSANCPTLAHCPGPAHNLSILILPPLKMAANGNQ